METCCRSKKKSLIIASATIGRATCIHGLIPNGWAMLQADVMITAPSLRHHVSKAMIHFGVSIAPICDNLHPNVCVCVCVCVLQPAEVHLLANE